MKNISTKKIIIIALLGTIGLLFWIGIQQKGKSTAGVDSFDKCVAAGNPVMESYPEQCSVNGKTYTNMRQAN
jgi:hypothetical protein